MKRTGMVWLAAVVLMAVGFPACNVHAEEATLDLGPGVFYLRFLTLPDETSLDSLFADQLPGGNEWKNAARIRTADQPTVEGSYYDNTQDRWRGTLKQLHVGRGYWIILPDNSPAARLVVQNARLEAGIAPWSSPQGVLITVENGNTVIRPASPPRGRASYEVVKEPVTSITASSGVYIQQPPQQGLAPSPLGSAQPQPITPGGTGGWVKVKLDTLYGHGASETWVPIAGQGTITVPPPTDFDTPPWGAGNPAE